jgi:spore germination protein KC
MESANPTGKGETVVRALKLGIVLLATLLLTGCWSYRDPDEVAWVVALGLDRGRENVLTVTLQIALAVKIAGGEPAAGGGGGSVLVVSMEAPSLMAALEMPHAWIDRKIDFSHTMVVIFGRELAETDFDTHLAPLVRFQEFRPGTHVLVANGRAEDLLRKADPVLEISPAKYWQLQTTAWTDTKFIPRSDLRTINMNSKSPGVAAVTTLVGSQREEEGPFDPTYKSKGVYMAGTIPRQGGPKTDMMGGAVIKDGRMVGVLNGDEVGIMKMVQGTFLPSIETVPDPLHPDEFIVLRVLPRRPPQVDIRIGEDGMPRVVVRVLLEGDIISIQSGEHYERPEKLRSVERAVEESIRRGARATLAKAQDEFGTDFFYLGYRAKRLFPTWQAWEEFGWDEKFPDAEISIDIDFMVRRTGLMLETVPMH